jgi:large subunit ribosomal protein L11
LKQAAGVAKGSPTVTRGAAVGKVTMDQVREIAEKKMADLNANDVDAACKMIIGSARSMGIDVVGS